MSEYTKEEILKLIEENGGPEGLDLSGKNLLGIDLSWEAIEAELEKARESAPGETPVWYSEWEGRRNLEYANLRGLDLWLANLQKAKLGSTDLQGTYLARANLQKANLSSTNFRRADLRGADLRGALLKHADLQEADLWLADLQGADLRRADLRGADLRGALQGAILEQANLQGADLWFANLRGADLWLANLQGADLACANLQKAKLRSTNLQGVELEYANLQEADLRYSHLEKVDLFGVESAEGAHFYNAFLNDTRLKREQLGEAIGEELEGKYDEAKEAYLALKNNFAEIGRYRDESWAYVKERQMGKMCSAPWRVRRFYGKSQLGDSEESRLPAWHPRVWWFYARHTWKWFWDWVAEVTCKYGESIFRTLGTMGAALVSFAVLYRLLGVIVDVSGNPSSGWLHCLLYSGGAFTTFGVDTLRPANDWIRALSILESAVGIALTGLLGFVLGNRIRRS